MIQLENNRGSFVHKCLVTFGRSHLERLFWWYERTVSRFAGEVWREIHLFVKYLGEENVQINDTLDGGIRERQLLMIPFRSLGYVSLIFFFFEEIFCEYTFI